MPVNFKNTQKPAAATTPSKIIKPTPGQVAWFRRGAASAEAVAKYEEEIQEKWEEGNRMFRFWLEEGGEARVTFVDGDLTDEGFLDILTYREHRLKGAPGKVPRFFTCTAEIEPCPLDEDGNDAYLAGALTIIDHREFKSERTKKTYKFMPRLYIATKNTIKKLQHHATAQGGLAGCTFDIARIGENSPRVGTEFTFVQKNSIEELQATWMKTDEKTKKEVTYFVPADYEREIGYIDAKTLREKYHFGSGQPIGAESKQPQAQKGKPVSFAGQL
jgi:hypothetical protein